MTVTCCQYLPPDGYIWDSQCCEARPYVPSDTENRNRNRQSEIGNRKSAIRSRCFISTNLFLERLPRPDRSTESNRIRRRNRQIQTFVYLSFHQPSSALSQGE